MSYSARALSPQDRDSLLQIWRDNMGDPRIAGKTTERFRWLYETNPSGPAKTWLGLAPAGNVIGCGSLYPRRMKVDGKLLKGGNLADFAVDKQHRLAGPAITIQRAIVTGSKGAGFDFVFGWPNAKSVAVVKRVGYAPIGATKSWVKPLRTSSRLAPVIAEKLPKLPHPELVAKVGGPVLDLALAARDLARRAPSLMQVRAQVLDRADARFDDLWARAKLPFIVGEKTSAYLNWRYAEFTTEKYQFYCLFDRRGGELRGYAAYTIRGDVAFIADLFVEDLDRDVDPLLLGLAHELRFSPVRSLSLTYIGTPRFTDRLPALGFFDRGGDRPLILWLEQPNAFLSDPDNWFMFDGELDI